jgi:dicarboxylate transporter 10
MQATADMASASEAAAVAKAAREEQKKQKMAKTAMRYPFWFGGSASSFAACVTHPLDLGELSPRAPTLAPSSLMLTGLLLSQGTR